MKHQHTSAYFVENSHVHRLQKVNSIFNEDWIQRFILDHPQSIPIDEIEPAFGSLLPVCRELRIKAGPVGVMFINPLGLITLVECKLWNNPEARRKVVEQILDHARGLAGMTYSKLEKAVKASPGATGASLYQIASDTENNLDEKTFVDRVTRNLKRGRFQLIIAGEGIREGIEQIVSLLQAHGNLSFSLALVEFSLFQMHGESTENFFVMPRILARTVEIERAVLSTDDGHTFKTPTPQPMPEQSESVNTTVSEQMFVEILQVDDQTRDRFRAFLEAVKQRGIYTQPTQPGSNSLMLKTALADLNLAIFTPSGTFYNTGIASRTNDFGLPEIGEQYLTGLAELIPGSFVNRSKSRFDWSVRKKEGNIRIEELLEIQDKWFVLVDTVLGEFSIKYEKS